MELVPILSKGGNTHPTQYKVISGQLPNGLQLNSETGAITGSPAYSGTAHMKYSTARIRAENMKGHTDCSISLRVQMHSGSAPADLFYAQQSMLLIVGQTFASKPSLKKGLPNTCFNANVLYHDNLKGAFYSTLPEGIVLDSNDGTLSGTPVNATELILVKITAYNDSGKTSFELTLVILAQEPPSALAYSSPRLTMAVGEVCNYVPTFKQGLPIASFSVSPALPRGLSLDERTGMISGTVMKERPRKAHTVLLQNLNGGCEFKFSLEVQLQEVPFDLQYPTEKDRLYYIFELNKAICPLEPILTEGNHILYSITPKLPNGLKLDPNIGCITGTPFEIAPKQTYTITASNRVGSADALLILATCSGLQSSHPREWSTDQVQLWAEEKLEVTIRQKLLLTNGAGLLQLWSVTELERALPGIDRTSYRLLLHEIEALSNSETSDKQVLTNY